VWVYCDSQLRCNASYQQCWLKKNPRLWGGSDLHSGGSGLHSGGSALDNTGGVKAVIKAPEPPAILVGVSDRWVSGSLVAAPEDHRSGAGRRPPR